MRTPFKNRTRGSAVVEVLLSVPFMFLFALAMQDFCRGYLSGQRGQRAARHLAWAEGRHQDDDKQPARPSDADLFQLHYRTLGGSITSTVENKNVQSGVTSGVDDLMGNLGAMGDLFNINNVGRGVISFLTGEVEGTEASVTQTVSGIRQLTRGATMTARHWVSLRSRRETYVPSDAAEIGRYGWWDPYSSIKDEIVGWFD